MSVMNALIGSIRILNETMRDMRMRWRAHGDACPSSSMTERAQRPIDESSMGSRGCRQS
jgi:hypothetical protein